MKCSGIDDMNRKSSRQWKFLVKMTSRSSAMVWKVARGDEEKIGHVCSQINRSVEWSQH